MRRILLGIAAVLALGLCFFIAWLNPNTVEFRFSTGRAITLQLGWLLIFAFLAGGLLAVFAVSLQQLGRRVAGWSERRRERQVARAGEWQESGTALAWDGDLGRGRSLLKRAWRRQPGNAAAALSLASSYMDTTEYATARQVLEEAIARCPHDADLRYALGEILRRSGESREAIRILETVRVEHPRAPRALLALRELYEDAGAWADAARIQEAYVETLPDSGSPTERQRLLHYRYQAARSIEDPAARVEALAALVQIDRSFVPAAVALGDALVEAGRRDEAKKHWERSFRAEPRLIFLERLLRHLDEPRERQRIVSLLQKHRQQLDADAVHLLTARMALDDDDVDAAATELQAVARQDAPVVQRYWAEIYQRRGQSTEALRSFSRVADSSGSLLTKYRCTACGRESTEWTGFCAGCDRWDTYRAAIERG